MNIYFYQHNFVIDIYNKKSEFFVFLWYEKPE
jgi:hypothetical protein